MKHIVLTILSLLFAANSFAEGYTWLVLHLRNGSTMKYIVADKLRMSFTDSDLMLTSSRLETSYAKDRVVSYNFTDDTGMPDNIEETEQGTIEVIHRSKDEIVLVGITSEQPIRVYSTNGTEQMPPIQRSGDSATILLSPLPNGVYIITLPHSDIPAIKVIH